MFAKNLLLVRFDFVLQNRAEELFDNLSQEFGSPVTGLDQPTFGGDKRRDRTFIVDDTRTPKEFNSLEIRAVESNNAFVEIVSVAEVDRSHLIQIALNFDVGGRQIEINHLKRQLESVQTWIPGDESGPETTILWADVFPNPFDYPDSMITPELLRSEFQSGVRHKFLRDFNVSAHRGIVVFEGNQVMFLGRPDRIFDHSLIIDLNNKLSLSNFHAPGALTSLIPGIFPKLSRLYGIHYWSKERIQSLQEVEEKIENVKKELPANNSIGLDEYLELDPIIFKLQREWTSIHSRIPGEHDNLLDHLDGIDFEYKATTLRSAPVEKSEDVLEAYRFSLKNQVEEIGIKEEQLNELLNSLSEFTSNQLSAISSQENQRLQVKVSKFTVLVAVLTLFLTADAAMTGGLSTFLDRIFSEGLSGVSNQVWTGFVLLGLVFLLRNVWNRD